MTTLAAWFDTTLARDKMMQETGHVYDWTSNIANTLNRVP
jgi:hypothetical protein